VINNVGLRGHYTASVYAARQFVKNQKGGLIVNVSSYGGGQYFLGVAYGVGKAGVDRLAVDMAHELKPHKVAAVSLWPGFVKTEFSQKKFKGMPQTPEVVVSHFLAHGCKGFEIRLLTQTTVT
jgi:NAD(P)-dependent dehydrogenase (short-subunit alcohol dehydrogenase family)